MFKYSGQQFYYNNEEQKTVTVRLPLSQYEYIAGLDSRKNFSFNLRSIIHEHMESNSLSDL